MKATYLRHMGTDLDVVNNARVSFSKESEWEYHLNDAGVELTAPTLYREDKKLIQFLARGMPEGSLNKLVQEIIRTNSMLQFTEVKQALLAFRNTPTHWAPFANGTNITFHIKAPIPIMRQMFKHKVGSVESEISRRYVDDAPEFFEPEWRRAAENVKQGSAGPHDMLGESTLCDFTGEHYRPDLAQQYRDYLEQGKALYGLLVKSDVCPEQARFLLPQAMYSEAIITHSLYGWANVYNQRTDPHAQLEVQQLARMIGEQIEPLYPVSWKALTAPLD
jgi:thymidylate synthase (FAD)